MKKLLLIVPLLLLAGCSSSQTWGWYVIDPTTQSGWTNVKFLISGMWATIQISLIAAVLSIVLGLMVALPGLSEKRGWRWVNRIYVEFVRAIPLLPMLFWCFTACPSCSSPWG